LFEISKTVVIAASKNDTSTLRICDWIDEFYTLLLAKFTFYFHDVLKPRCLADFDHTIVAMKSPNFVQLFGSFQRKTEPLAILIIANRCDASDISPIIGYSSRSEFSEESELRKNFVVLLRMGIEMHDLQPLLPSISALIQESAARANSAPERITYCYDQMIFRSFFVLPVEYNFYVAIVFARKVGERDSAVVNFLLSNCSQLRGSKVFQSLRKCSN
uniref:RAB3GAP2_C domain-containing protein n=1 Tax=Gongylonema pulchrum TaxID=637853 RepID=A0A183DCB2_9BILA